MKKLLFLILLVILLFFIYKATFQKETLFLTIGSKEGDIYYDKEDLRITEISMAIAQNEMVSDRTFQNALVKASTIQIDANRIIRLTTYRALLTQLDDLEELFILMRKYCKEKISILPLKENSEMASYMNQKISILGKKYDIIISR